MKNFFDELNKSFESRVRLGIMSILLVNDWMDFSTLRDMLKITDGNLASHITSLEKDGYIQVKKKFVDKKPNTSYAVTRNGRKAFNDHLDALEKILKQRE